MKEIYWLTILTIFIFGFSVFTIFFPPIMLFFTILGIIGMFVSLFYLAWLIACEV